MEPDEHRWLLEGSGDPAEVAGYYDAWAGSYDSDLDGWAYSAPDVVARYVNAHAAAARTILDAGCGTGRAGIALREIGFTGELHGVDVSAASLPVAEATGEYDSLAVADLQQPLSFDDDTFDVLVCVGVMTYLPDVEATWREFSRVVRSGGLVVATQRSDLWEARDCTAVVDRLTEDGTWEPLEVTEPRPYLPGNDDYADQIGVHYVVCRVG